MKSFLKYVAEDIIRDYGTDLSRIMVVFPNKRASLFLNEELMKIVQKPFWSPNYMTISDMFLQNTSLQLADPIKLICDLHKSFVKCTGVDETLDHFYGWGNFCWLILMTWIKILVMQGRFLSILLIFMNWMMTVILMKIREEF